MSFPFKTLVFLLTVMVVVATTRAADHIVDERRLGDIGYQRFWETGLDLSAGGNASEAYLLDDTLYVMTDKGSVNAVHAGVGLTRWAQNLTTSAYRIFTPYHFQTEKGDHLVVFSTANRVAIVDRYAGDIIVDFPLRKAMSSPTIADATNIYFGSADGHMYAMIWRETPRHEPIQRWRVMAGGPVTSMPVLADDGQNLLFASQGGSLYSCTAAYKIFNWKFTTGGPIIGDFFLDPSGAYVASTDRSLYRVEAGSGIAQWRIRFPEPLREGPVVLGRTVYQYVPGDGIAAVDADEGKLLWQNPDARYFLCHTLEHVYAMSDTNRVLELDAETGRTVKSIEPNEPVIPVRNLIDESIYLVNSRGEILCARPAGTPYLTPDQIKSARLGLRKPPATQAAATASDEPQPLGEKRGPVDMTDPLRSPSDVAPVGGGR